MSQPISAEGHDRAESDPLLAFNAELAADPPSPAPPVEVPASPVKSDTPLVPPEPAAEPAEPVDRVDRLAKAERGLERAQIEIVSLKSDLATLVGTIEDIRKRLRQRPEPPQVVRRHHRSSGVAVALVLIGLAGGVLVWRALAMLAANLPASPPIQVESTAVPITQAPASPTSAAGPQLQAVADVGPAMPESDQPESAARRVAYVGTLSIDADPGGEVYINRKTAGRTPLRVQQVRAGSHLIWIERDGFQRWTRVVQVPADRITRVSATLEPK